MPERISGRRAGSDFALSCERRITHKHAAQDMTAAALDHELRRLGLLVRQEWLAACREHLTASVASFDALPLDKQVRPAL